jgi:tetratricopeptide (TPR) repeat protein
MRTVARNKPEFFLLIALTLFATVSALRWIQSNEQPEAATAGLTLESVALRGQARAAQDVAANLQEYLRQNPADPNAYAQLGSLYLQLARESGDPSYYAKADEVFDAALRYDAASVDAMLGKGALALARHQFAEALAWGERARPLNPYRAQTLGVIGDAQVELGRYEEAIATIQQMIDTRPDLASYSRVSYLRELHGDTQGAIEMMARAAEAGGPAAENTAWTIVQLGNLHFNSGDLDAAEREYARATALLDGYVHGQAGLARVQAARGQHEQAIASYRAAIERMPLPEFVIALGELYAHLGRAEEAEQQWALVRAMQQLNAAAGMDVDLELAMFEVQHGTDPSAALEKARAAYERRPSIHAADVLAWALLRNGEVEEAARRSAEALRLGTQDAGMRYRAGRIAEAQGDAKRARTLYREALDINPFFSLRDAEDAAARLML